MANPKKEILLKYGIPALAIVVIFVQLFLVNTKNLNRWKGGGYGMYSELHYKSNQIHIPGMSIDSLLKDNREMKRTLGYVMLIPNTENLKKAAELILKTTKKDSVHIQVWKSTVNSKDGHFTRVLIEEIYRKTTDF